MKRRWLSNLLGASTALALLYGCAGNGGGLQGDPAIKPIGQNSFIYVRNGNEIMKGELDGSMTSRVFLAPSGIENLRLSPDRKVILFTMNSILQSVNVDGSDLREVAGFKCADWSEDGSMIFAITSTNWIVRVKPDGTGKANLVYNGASGGGIHHIDVTADGRKIAFTSYRTTYERINLINSDGTSHLDLYSAESRASRPRWNQAGSAIVFERRQVIGAITSQSDVYSMASTGGSLMKLTSNAVDDTLPCFAQNGTILFVRNGDVMMMQGDGSVQSVWLTTPEAESSSDC